MASMGDAQRVGQGGLSKLTDGPRTTSDLSKVGGGLTRGPNQGKKLAAAAWSETWPAPQSTLDLDFANDRGWVRGVGQGKSMDAVTFTRASVGKYVDQDGVVQDAANGVPRFDWASTAQVAQVNSLRYTEAFDNATWTKFGLLAFGSGSVANTNATTDPFGGNDADLITETSVNEIHTAYQNSVSLIQNEIYTFSCYAKSNGRNVILRCRDAIGGGTTHGMVSVNLSDGSIIGTTTGTANINALSNSWYRISISFTALSAGIKQIIVYTTDSVGNTAYLGDGTSGIYVYGAQLETGSSTSTYQSIGAFTPTNTPLAANPTSNGLLIEESRTNRILWCRDATQANWTKTNVTAAKDQTGIDGVANAASSLTATANDGTCVQTITLASGSRTGSVYLKRITGTGNVQVSLDGSTYSTVDLSASEWRRIVISGTVTNPTVGIKLAVSGDAVAMDYGQVEDLLYASTPILTTTASVTRAIDLTIMSGENFNNFYNQFGGTFFLEGEVRGRGTINGYAVGLRLGTTNTVRIFGRGSGSTEYVRPAISSSDFFGSFGLTSEEYKFKEIFAYKNGYASVAINGNRNSSTGVDNLTNAIMPQVNNLQIAGTQPFTIKYIKYTPQVLSAVAVKEFSK